MKTYFNILLIIILLSFSLQSCKEEERGQYPVDSISPQPVSNPTVTNFPGGSRIDYQLPDESDLLYVKVSYRLPNGNMAEVRTSVFANHVELKGFAKSQKTTVQLYCVDRSQNVSQPVDVEIEPEDSPIYDIFSSIEVSVGFGGFKLNWENPALEDIAVEVMKKDDEGNFKPIETFYSSEKKVTNKSVRGQDPVETEFAVYVRDTYDNNSDTLKTKMTPWYESELDKTKWVALPKSNKFTLHSYGKTNLSVVWDGVYNVDNGVYYISENSNKDEPYFTFDLGVQAKLSRFKYWSRYDYIFKLHSPKKIVILGTNDPAVAANSDSNESEWILMGEYESIRPSGLPGGTDATSEDRAYANAGEEFEFSLDKPEVRYIRFLSRISWTNTRALFVSELTFWGEPNE
jgi:hypothetical protein